MAHTPSRKTPRSSLVIDPEREHRVRERAYYLWEAEGKPHGRDVEYWERARELVAVEESAVSDPTPAPQPKQPSSRKTSPEGPGNGEDETERLEPAADAGDAKPAASAKRKARAKPKKR